MTDASIILSGNKPINHSKSIAEAMGLVQNAIDAPMKSKMLGEQVRSAGLQNDYQAMVNQRAPTMLDQQTEQNRIANESGNLTLESQQQLQHLRNAAPDAYQMSQLIDAGQPDRARALLAKRIKMLQDQGRDSSDSEAIMQQLEAGNIDGVRSELQSVVDTSVRAGVFGLDSKGKPAGVQEWEYYSKLPPDQQAAYREMQRGYSDPIALAAQRSGININEYASKRGIEANTAPAIAAGTERGKMGVQAEMQPGIEQNLTEARKQGENNAEAEKLRKANSRAYFVYNTGIENLRNRLLNTTTGPLVGSLPALTSEAQTAKGAVAAMGPVMKDMFRTAGEGVFTDSDQKLLMDMLPTRQDNPDAIEAKIGMINDIVKAKLGMSSGSSEPAQQGGNSFTTSSGIKFTVE